MFDAVGWVAVVLTQVFYIPNTLKILRTHDVQGYSLPAWTMLFIGLGCYLAYFASRGDLVGVVANVCGMAGSGLTLSCIWFWRERPADRHAGLGATATGAVPLPIPTEPGDAAFPGN